MGTQNVSLLTLSIAASAAVSACRFISKAGAHAAAGGGAIGVSQSAAASGELVPYDVIGTAVVESGAAFAVGDLIQSDASGRAIKATASAIKTAVIAGGSAGALTVTGLGASDRLVSVTRMNRDATAANVTLDSLTSEFSITAANTIDNTGGTATTGDALLVVWETEQPVRGRALQAAGASGQFVEVLLFNH